MSGSGFPAGGPSTHGMPQQPGNGMIGANQAAAQTVGAPGGQGAQNWNQWFGEPAGGKVHLDPYEAYRRENFQLPEAYKGHNVYLTTVLIQLITEDDMWPARIALPFRVTENENTIVWDEIHFNNTLLNPVPEEGASRLVTQQTSERQDHYVRYGLAFMLEHGKGASPLEPPTLPVPCYFFLCCTHWYVCPKSALTVCFCVLRMCSPRRRLHHFDIEGFMASLRAAVLFAWLSLCLFAKKL